MKNDWGERRGKEEVRGKERRGIAVWDEQLILALYCAGTNSSPCTVEDINLMVLDQYYGFNIVVPKSILLVKSAKFFFFVYILLLILLGG